VNNSQNKVAKKLTDMLITAAIQEWAKFICNDAERITPETKQKLLQAIEKQYREGLAQRNYIIVTSYPGDPEGHKAYVAACKEAGLTADMNKRDGGDRWVYEAWAGFSIDVSRWKISFVSEPYGPSLRLSLEKLAEDALIISAINELDEMPASKGRQPKPLPKLPDGTIDIWQVLQTKRPVSQAQKKAMRQQVNETMVTLRKFMAT
jgi:hypothetical protein